MAVQIIIETEHTFSLSRIPIHYLIDHKIENSNSKYFEFYYELNSIVGKFYVDV